MLKQRSSFINIKQIIFAGLISSLLISNANAAIELTSDQAQSFKPYEKITIKGNYSSIAAQVDAANKAADKKGAHAFYVEDSFQETNSRLKVIVALYKQDAETVNPEDDRISYKGIKNISRTEYEVLEPFDFIEIEGAFTNSVQINEKLAELAKAKGAASFYIIDERDSSNGGSRKRVKALIYKADAPRHERRASDLIPAGSEAAAKAIAEGRADLVEMPTEAQPMSEKLKFWDGDSSRPEKRYTVTLNNGTKIQEVNRATAQKMQSFKSIQVKGNFRTGPEISEAVAKQAAKEGAKFYRITLEKEANGSNKIIYADLFK